jgi:peptidoglycan hydrolase-like protein with peptidoglycan-binding domain
VAVTLVVSPRGVQALTAAELQVQIDALIAQLATLQAQLTDLEGGETTTGTITGVPAGFTFENALKQGMSGDEAKYLQIVLNSDSATQVAASGVGSSGNETTYFGSLTNAAVVKFQEKYAADVLATYGLTSGTGLVGSTTRDKLNEILGK